MWNKREATTYMETYTGRCRMGGEDFKNKGSLLFYYGIFAKACSMYVWGNIMYAILQRVYVKCILNSLNFNRDKNEKLMETKTHFGGGIVNVSETLWRTSWCRYFQPLSIFESFKSFPKAGCLSSFNRIFRKYFSNKFCKLTWATINWKKSSH